jgi:hypothetical protein
MPPKRTTFFQIGAWIVIQDSEKFFFQTSQHFASKQVNKFIVPEKNKRRWTWSSSKNTPPNMVSEDAHMFSRWPNVEGKNILWRKMLILKKCISHFLSPTSWRRKKMRLIKIANSVKYVEFNAQISRWEKHWLWKKVLFLNRLFESNWSVKEGTSETGEIVKIGLFHLNSRFEFRRRLQIRRSNSS